MYNNNDSKLLESIMFDNVLNQVQLAKILNTSKQFISQIVNGKRTLSNKLLLKLQGLYPQYFANYNLQRDFTCNDLKEMRLHYKFSREQFASILGISDSLLTKIENGQRSITNELKERVHLFNNNNFSDNVNLKPIRRFDALEIKYCSDILLPADNNLLSKSTETVVIDKKLLLDNSLDINPYKCKIITISNNSLSPIFKQGDRCVIDESFKHFVDQQLFAFVINGQCYLRQINILPNRIKCTSISDNRDTFYIENEKETLILGLIVSRTRF